MALTMVALFVGCSNVDHLTISLCGEVTASLNHGQVQVFSLPKTKSKSFIHYIPSSCEIYIMEHATELGYDSALNPTGCNIWNIINDTSEVICNHYKSYSNYLTITILRFEDLNPFLIG